MGSLFVRIFLAFLLTILLVSTVVVTLVYVRDREFPPLAHQDFIRAAIAEYGREAIRHYEQGGAQELDDFTAQLKRKSDIRLSLFDDQATPLSNRPLPRKRLHMVLRALQSGEVVFPMGGSGNGLASVFVSPAGEKYVVALVLPHRPSKKTLWKEISHGFLGWRLFILLAVAAAVCFVLARSLASPIQRLRTATRNFADGNLSVRIGKQIKGSSEIAGLATDFDDMAAKIEDLVLSQKRLLRDISHELRSPLTRLGLGLELARTQDDPEARMKALARIGLESERMNTMIGQLLELTRLESGTKPTGDRPLDLTKLLSALVEDARFEAQAAQSDVVARFPERPVRVVGSEELIGQALENVIRNAVKYTDAESTVEVEMTDVGGQVLIRILDHGPGVPEEALDKLFEPFYRVADARERETGGTGIGLAIARHSIQAHGGSIRALNRSGRGLEVEILLPKNI